MPLRATYNAILKDLGFSSAKDWLASAYGLSAYSAPLLKLQLSATAFTAGVAFCAQYIWSPPQALLVLLVLDLLNGFYGWKVAAKVRGEPWRFSEAQRTIGKIISTLILLGLTKWSIDSYPKLKSLDLDFALFCWLAGLKGRKLLAKMVALRVQEGGLANLIKTFVQSRFGEYSVGTAQGKKLRSDLSDVPPASPAAPDQPSYPTPPTSPDTP